MNRFARDMRLIWKNAKAYNAPKTPVWNYAHILSLEFERLYEAWVVSFTPEESIFKSPLYRPWQHSCRSCCSEKKNTTIRLMRSLVYPEVAAQLEENGQTIED